MSKKLKIVLWDIETTLATMGSFSLWPDSISHKHIIKDWSITCICWKVLGEKKVHSVETFNGDDKALCQKIRKEFEDVDILIHHNGDKFDVKKLNARLMIHGIDPMPPILTIDTLKAIKKVANFTSHRLDYLGQVLCNDTKLNTTTGLWIQVLKGSRKAVNEMVKYCKQDVNLLEKLYLKIRPYMKGHPNISDGTAFACPACGSKNYIKYGTRRMKSGVLYQRFKCQDCGTVFQSALRIDKPTSRAI